MVCGRLGGSEREGSGASQTWILASALCSLLAYVTRGSTFSLHGTSVVLICEMGVMRALTLKREKICKAFLLGPGYCRCSWEAEKREPVITGSCPFPYQRYPRGPGPSFFLLSEGVAKESAPISASLINLLG